MGSTFGHHLKLHTFGESHGAAIGGILEGIPSKIQIDPKRIQDQLSRRRPGQSSLTTQRKELDTIEWLSGIFEGQTLGSPIGFFIRNKDSDPSSYAPFKNLYRPSHADMVYDKKYGIRDWRGGGRASARETAVCVAGGSLAEQILEHFAPIEIVAWVEQIGSIKANVHEENPSRIEVDASPARCPDPLASEQMIKLIHSVKKEKDTVGGLIKCVCRNVPIGLGEPCFDKLEADLAKAMLSIPATKGFSIGSGFDCVSMRGSEHNDPIISKEGQALTKSNHSGGIQGGISNGMPIVFTVPFKPVATIFRPQETISQDGSSATINPRGRHDPCVVPRAVPIVEAMAALVLCDHYLRQRAISS